MATFVLIPGAGSDSWYWHLVEPVLRQHGHDVVAVDLPCDDDSADLGVYTDTVVDAIDGRREVVLVAQSLGGSPHRSCASASPSTRWCSSPRWFPHPASRPVTGGRTPVGAWPDVATSFLVCRDDRFFPAAFQRRVVHERLGIVPDEMGGGHLPALARPDELAAHLLGYRAALEGVRT